KRHLLHVQQIPGHRTSEHQSFPLIIDVQDENEDAVRNQHDVVQREDAEASPDVERCEGQRAATTLLAQREHSDEVAAEYEEHNHAASTHQPTPNLVVHVVGDDDENADGAQAVEFWKVLAVLVGLVRQGSVHCSQDSYSNKAALEGAKKATAFRCEHIRVLRSDGLFPWSKKSEKFVGRAGQDFFPCSVPVRLFSRLAEASN